MPFENIRDSQFMNAVLKHISFDSVLLLDLDNTVLESQIELGSDPWFVMLCNHAIKVIPDKDKAITMAIAIYHEIQQIVRAQAIEHSTIKIIYALQDIGIPVLAITARDRCLQPATVRQLRDIGVNLDALGITKRSIDLDGDFASNNKPFYKDGIIYCGGKDKGKCFRAFLEDINGYPKHVVMVDDKQKHLEHVQEAVEDLGIRFDGIRYGFLDEKVAQFDFHQSHQQLECVKHRLPHETQYQIKLLDLKPKPPSDTCYAQFFYPKRLEVPIEEDLSDDMEFLF